MTGASCLREPVRVVDVAHAAVANGNGGGRALDDRCARARCERQAGGEESRVGNPLQGCGDKVLLPAIDASYPAGMDRHRQTSTGWLPPMILR